MRLLLAFCAITASGDRGGRTAAPAKANAQQDPHRVCLCGRPLERAARRRRRRAPHQRSRYRKPIRQFSPDGTHIAFTGEYDGNVDVFVVPASGGVPKRLTWHPAADRVLGWTPDGKRIIFGSSRTSYSRFGEMFTVPAEGGVEEKLPLPTGYEASMSADGAVDRLRAHRQGLPDVEEISRRPDRAHLAGPPLRQHHHQSAAHQFQ